MDDLAGVLNTLLMVGVVSAVAPLIVALLPGLRVPQIVLLIIGGIMIGPQGFGLSDPAARSRRGARMIECTSRFIPDATKKTGMKKP